jgi:hypothetical protein
MVTTLPTLMLATQARPGFLGESALAPRQRLIDFAVDPKAPDAVRDIPAYALAG